MYVRVRGRVRGRACVRSVRACVRALDGPTGEMGEIFGGKVGTIEVVRGVGLAFGIYAGSGVV